VKKENCKYKNVVIIWSEEFGLHRHVRPSLSLTPLAFEINQKFLEK